MAKGVSVRTWAELAGLPVGWDQASQTVSVGKTKLAPGQYTSENGRAYVDPTTLSGILMGNKGSTQSSL